MKKHAKKVIVLLLAVAMIIPTVAMLYSSAATSFTVELAFDNLFVFDHWVTNGNSMIIDNDNGSTNAGSITEVDLEKGSFKFTNNTNHNIYTRAAAGTGEKAQENFDYYRMPVEEGVTYTLSFNLSGNIPAFYPFVFFYNESNEFMTLTNGAFSGEGDHAFKFTVPTGSGIRYIQLRLTLGGNDAKTAYAVVKDICVSRYGFETDSTNLFNFDTWAANTNSSALQSSWNYDDGTIKIDAGTDSFHIETNTDSSKTSGNLFTGFSLGSMSGYYTMDVEPNTTYVISCNVSDADTLYFTPYIVRYKSDGSNIDYMGGRAITNGVNKYMFTTTADTEYISISFASEHANNACSFTVSDIGIYKVNSTTDYKVDPVRDTYTYNSSNTATYGTLPTPPAATYPENYIFAGWYTEPDGKGTRIASDTEILPQSMTVYPKFEPAVDTLTVKTPPTKTTYTVGEKINTTGLVLTYGIVAQENIYDSEGKVTGTQEVTRTTDISSGFYITPEYASSTAGTQTITAHYGNKTATFTVTVSAGDDKNIVVNGATHAVTVANNNYTINYQAPTPFNRYEMTYFSDSYVKGEIVMDGVTEVFFLEPSNNGTFASYIDSFLRGVNHYNVDSIKFTCLDKEFGNFELLSVTTIAAAVPSSETQYYENTEFKVGIDLSFGGVVSEIYDLKNAVVSRVYNIDGKNVAKVDYAERLDAEYSNYTLISEDTTNINLINKFDRGRYLQQSYYGTSQKPYELGDYNGQPWPYNPVQGGNLVVNDANGNPIKGNEASKVIDYRITDDQIYIKTRPLDWGKNSDDYPDSYVTDSYMEAWYVFEDGMIKTYCRFVDYSGYPAHTRDQELPAVYIIEPLNHFVYNPVADGSEWETTDYTKIEEPDFWGVLPEYNALLKADGKPEVDPTVDCYENWAAFTASDNEASFGVGVYSAGATDFHYGCFFPIYNETEAKNGQLVATENRHAVTTDPATENPTSYISPVSDMTFESYKPIEYSYYLTTGTANEIHDDFEAIAKKESQADLDKPKIAVPETVYMTPANGASTVGQYYVNNLLDASNNYNITTEAKRNAGMSIGLHIKDAASFSVKVTNATDPSNDIFLCNTSGSEISESTRLSFDATDTYNNTTYGLRFSGAGLQPGQKATAKWEITVYLDDGTTETYTAYTVMYAPGRTVGAVAEARQVAASQNEISSWITGANGVDHSIWAPLGSLKGDFKGAGYFTNDPLYNENPPTGGSGGDATDYIEEQITGADVDNNVYDENNYVMQTATNDHDSSRARSYLGLLTVDKSRYTNTNQIPNLEIGYDALRIGSYEKNSIGKYTTYYTLGTESSYTATSLSEAPSGWTVHSDYTDLWEANGKIIPYRERVIPAFNVSEIDGKYIHALNQAKADQNINSNQYSTAGTSVLCSVTDKSDLRDTVTDGYAMKEEDYSEDSYNKFLEELEDAATVLGDPSASQDEIDQANKELTNVIEKMTEAYYSLKYDNLFSAYEYSQYSRSMMMNHANGSVSYENGVITTVNTDLGTYINEKGEVTKYGETYTLYDSPTDCYNIDLKPNTDYVFEYDVTTDSKAQAFMFFYNSTNGSGDKPTNIKKKINDGDWTDGSESNAWWGNYTSDAGTYHYVIKFTTGANTYKARFRFGNTSNGPVTSTFSNIRLIDAAHYYEDATYSKTEDVYKKYASYGTLVTPVRPGYTFNGWKDADGNTVTGATIAEKNLSIYSQWTEHSYTIVYNSNSGSGTVASKTVKYTETVALASDGFTKTGYTLLGWSTDSGATTAQYQLGQNVSKLTDVNGSTVALYAVWASAKHNVTFDNMFDFDAFNISTYELNINERTDTGFTVTSTGEDANTDFSYTIDVEAGKTYILSADTAFVPKSSDSFDMYVQALDKNGAADATFTRSEDVGVESGCYMVKHGNSGTQNISIKFTAGTSTAKVKIRFDANDSGNKLTVNNIRFYEDTGITVSPVNKYVSTDSTYGTLPTPTRAGYTFQGWYDGNDLVTESTKFTKASTVYLTSKWAINNTALTEDTVVIDFDSPVTFAPLENDTVFMKAATASGNSYKFLGFSENGNSNSLSGTYGTFSVSGNNVTYTPSKTVDGVETVTYYASVSENGVATTLSDTITLVPASNVLYEEDMFKTTGASGEAWSTVSVNGVSANGNQTSSSDKDVYGNDTSYGTAKNYSNNSALSVTLDKSKTRSNIISFTFTGTGFDLYGACGPTTGVQIVSIKNSEKVIKGALVDTYYNDTAYGTLYQVPIVSMRDLDYDTYTIQITASYLGLSGALKNTVSTQSVDGFDGMTAYSVASPEREVLADALRKAGLSDVLEAESLEVIWFDEDSTFNGGDGVNTVEEGMLSTASDDISLLNVVDSVRVYNPIENGDDYYIASEKGAQYFNVSDNLLSGDGLISSTGVAYIVGNDNESISTAAYSKKGPKDEIYLSGKTEAITFSIANLNADSKVMISLRAAKGSPSAKIAGNTVSVSSNTEMYYDITEYVKNGSVTIQNDVTGTLLAIGTIKVTGQTTVQFANFDLETAAIMMATPVISDDATTPDSGDDVTPPEDDNTGADTDNGDGTDDTSDKKCAILEFFNWIIALFKKILEIVTKLFRF